MRGGRFERGGGDGNVRNAEVLLESRSVAEIREVEFGTRKEIRDKQEELRQLVGASYRDLIDSADSIVIMGKCCDCIMANLSGMSDGFDRLKDSLKISASAASSLASSASGSNREELYGIGSRVKYLVDTPEKIWGCLDEHMYLEGAERFLRARQVHGLLLASETGGTHFPQLWHHQWPMVEVFQGQISLRSRERLQETGLSAVDYAVALAAIAIVEDLSSAQVFSLFIDTRKAWVRSYLRMKMLAAASPLQDKVLVLSRVVDMIQLTLCHIGQLFLEVSNGTSPLLFTTVLTAPPSSQLFGGIFNPEKEVRAWKRHREKLDASMVPLSGEFLAQSSLSFLTACAQELFEEARPVLDGVLSGKDLAEMERSIRLHIEKQDALQDSLDWLRSVFGQAISSPWEFLSTLLLNSTVNLWDTLFENIFLKRLRAIIDSRIAGITIMSAVERHLNSINSSFCFQKTKIGVLRSVLDDSGQVHERETSGREWTGEISLYFGPDVSRLKDEVDDGLKAILLDLVMFLGDPQSPSRVSELDSFLHEKVFLCMSNICKGLKEKLERFSSKDLATGTEIDGLVTLERALFLGKLSLALGKHLHYLPVIFGSSGLWMVDHRTSSEALLKEMDVPEFRSSRRVAAGDDSVSPRLKTLQAALGAQWDMAYKLWVSWSTDLLVKIFIKDLAMDDGLSATSFPKGWEETVFKQGVDSGESEIKISLPAMPSPSAVSLVFVANQEIYRVGGHVLDKSVIQLFAAELLDKVLAAYESFLSRDSQISERGSLQLLFDVRLLADVLIGVARPKSPVKLKSLFATLSSRLDPIDWATYEPQLWENEHRCYQRCAVLFGFLTQLNRLYTEIVLRNQPVTDGNTIGLATSIPRFVNLPISMPLVGGSSAGARAINGRNSEGEVSDAWKVYNQQQQLKEPGAMLAFDESTGLTSLVNAPLLKSFMGQVGSRIGEGTFKFGSIIGESQVGRLRDKSAAAISSTLGDMLPALSSLAAGASKLEGYDTWRVP